ncbi:hypothetical protein NQZ68_003342 [Dissostichus eleginoides]|nr:hypothetical protein NQZ68_003342 [Dissostichus eleginoides]
MMDYGPGCNTKDGQCTTSYSHPGVNGARDGVLSRVLERRKVHVYDAKADLRAASAADITLPRGSSPRLESHQGLSLPL